MEKVTITIPGQNEFEVDKGTLLIDIIDKNNINAKKPILVAKANNKLVDLNYVLDKNTKIEYVYYDTLDGRRVYEASMSFLLMMAMKEICPQYKLTVEHSLGPSYYCEVSGDEPFTTDMLDNIQQRMEMIVNENVPFEREILEKTEAIEYFKKNGNDDKLRLLKYVDVDKTIWYKARDYKDFFYVPLVVSSGYLRLFNLHPERDGFVVLFPDRKKHNRVSYYIEQKQLSTIYKEHERWAKLLEVFDVGNLNEKISRGEITDIIKLAEALQEKKLAYIADSITERKAKVVLIAGPSSAGKTTFSKRLNFQLRVNGIKPLNVSLDDYFVDRDKTPLDEKGEYEFESIEAIEVKLFNDHLNRLIEGESIELPKFDFKVGGRIPSGRIVKLEENDVVLVEGLHALNEKLTSEVDKRFKFKIYVSALTQLNIDDHNRVSTSDTRLIRRMVRDSFFRAHTVQSTIKRWPSVRKGEEKNIFPFQEQADVMFNSALVYEHAILKKYAINLLKKVTREEEAYSEAHRLIRFLNLFLDVTEEEQASIPSHSIIREFIGGSEFQY